jgi:2-(1,2-epoxy-1,2-dihydrophenyl)acetyl-CoA isomerase
MAEIPTFETLLLAVDDGVAHLTLNRPEAANGINIQMGRDLRDASIFIDEDPAVRAVLLTANGKLFCAGGDLKTFATFGSGIGRALKSLTTDLHAAQSRFMRMRAPVVIAVHGAAAGAGFPLAMIGDIVLASTNASFTMAYTAAGLSPDGGSTFILPRLIGMRRMQELTLLNRRLSAAEALDWGLVTRVVEPEVLLAEAKAIVAQLASGPTEAFASTRRLLLSSIGSSLEEQMELEAREIAANSIGADGVEGIAAFVGKRPAVYQGRR